MTKYYGRVGYGVSHETSPGIFSGVTEQNYYGDVLSFYKNSNASENIIDDFDLNLTISIVADAFALRNFAYLKYAEYMGSFWKIKSAKPNFPRIEITLGGLYNGELATTV